MSLSLEEKTGDSKYNWTFPLFSVIVLCGVSNVGKSVTARHIHQQLTDQLKQHNVSNPVVHLVSSDAIRLQILQGNESIGTASTVATSTSTINKYGCRMQEISKNAFIILETMVEQLIKFPARAHYVIVDSTDLSLDFHHKLTRLAHQSQYHAYCVGFQYRKLDEYMLNPGSNAQIVSNHFKRLQALVPNLKKLYHKPNGDIFWIKKRMNLNEMNIQLNTPEVALLKSCQLDPERKYFIIGDVHECLDAVIDLLHQNGFTVQNQLIQCTEKTQNTDIVFVGDLVDKGDNPQGIISFLYSNLFCGDDDHDNSNTPSEQNESKEINLRRPKIHLVKGNHDHKLYQCVKDYETTIKNSKSKSFHEFYSSYQHIQNLPELQRIEIKRQFVELYERAMIPFAEFQSNDAKSRSFFVTHAPCHPRYLGKLDHQSFRAMRDWGTDDRDNDLWPQLMATLPEESFGVTKSTPLHVMGHIALNRVFLGMRAKDQNPTGSQEAEETSHFNWVMVDTGPANGNALSAVLLGNGCLDPQIRTVAVKAPSQWAIQYKHNFLDQPNVLLNADRFTRMASTKQLQQQRNQSAETTTTTTDTKRQLEGNVTAPEPEKQQCQQQQPQSPPLGSNTTLSFPSICVVDIDQHVRNGLQRHKESKQLDRLNIFAHIDQCLQFIPKNQPVNVVFSECMEHMDQTEALSIINKVLRYFTRLQKMIITTPNRFEMTESEFDVFIETVKRDADALGLGKRYEFSARLKVGDIVDDIPCSHGLVIYGNGA